MDTISDASAHSENSGDDNCETFVCNSSYEDKLRLIGRYWPSTNDSCRGIILFVHGFGEHCQRYTHVAHFFNKYGFASVAFDFRGHGLSDGERGFAPKLDAFLDDLESIIERIRTQYQPDVPLVIYAHGTGSLLCLAHIIRRPSKPLDCQAMVISTPSICLKRRPTKLLLFFARTFANLDPHFLLPVQGNYTHVYTNDPAVVEAYRKDPLVHDRWTASTVTIFMEVGVLLEKTILEAPWPLLIQHGDADTVTPISGIRKWVRNRVRGDARFKEWSGHFHELHNDLGKEEILMDAINWIYMKLQI